MFGRGALKTVVGSLDGTAGRRRRIRRHLGLLIVAASALLGRLAIELLSQLRLFLISRRRQRHPELAPQLLEIDRRLRDGRTARWQSWRGLSIGRRFEIGAAAAVMLFVGAILVRVAYSSRWQVAHSDATSGSSSHASSSGDTASTAAVEAGSGGQPATAAVDLEAAARRFQSAMRAAAPGTWTYLPEGPVLAPGAIDDWDDFAIGYTSVLRDAAAPGAGYQLWYRGCALGVRGQSCAIGHAKSPDGIRWTKTPGPAFVPPESHAIAGLRSLTVVQANGRYYMWYSIAPSWFDRRKNSTLHLATSNDGVKWEGVGQVFAGTEQIERHLDPSAVWDGEQFHLWIVDTLQSYEGDAPSRPDNGPFLRHLVSQDGRTWKEGGSFPLGTLGIGHARPTVEARAGGGYRAVLFDPDDYVALVWIDSADGNTWELVEPSKSALVVPPADQVELVDDATALEVSGGTLAWLAGGTGGRHGIRVAFLRR